MMDISHYLSDKSSEDTSDLEHECARTTTSSLLQFIC